MAIFRRFFEDVFPMVPTLLRRTAGNLINVTYETMFKGMDAVAQALEEYVDAWPIDTAPGWVLDTHWGPYHNLQRNGMTDADYRLYIHAKRLLNKSWGAGPQALGIFALLLPAAGLTFSYFAPKSWVVNITGVDMATAAPAILFMTKRPSPEGGGFSVAGDNGVAVISDAVVFTFNSIYNVVPPSVGWYSSVHGASGGAEAGWAHAAMI